MIHENLRKVIGWLILQGRAASQRELATRMGYNPSAFSQILNGHVPVSDKFLNRLAAFESKININWIKYDKGEMLFSSNPLVESSVTGEQDDFEYFTENNNGARFYKRGDQLYMTVRHVPFAAFGRFANESDRLDPQYDEWREETYEVDRVARGHYLSFEVQGDSMDTGTRQSFEAGDKVLCRELERVFWRDRIRFESHPYWVVVFGSSVLIKQMTAQDMERGVLTFHSLNPSPQYADFELNMDEIRMLFYVIKKKPREIVL